MFFLRMSRLLSISIGLLFAIALLSSRSGDAFAVQLSQGTPDITAPCVAALATGEAPMSTASATVTASATMQATVEVTAEATQGVNAPIQYVSFTPTDIRFNPNREKPFALITVYSLIFKSQMGSSLHIEKPQFQLAINKVPWGVLASTDFQTGDLMPYATQGIVLQNLLIIAKATPDQQVILECLKAHQPVDLTLTGTLDAFPDGSKQSVGVTLTTRQIVLHERQ